MQHGILVDSEVISMIIYAAKKQQYGAVMKNYNCQQT